jgi:CDP-diacylglycerol---glycerol-3-phosphate 3-phosphatidyltransferase
MTLLDLHASVLLLVLVVGIAGSYAVRVALAGPAHFARVDAAGASPFLGTGAMEMAYWSLQPVAQACVWAGFSANGITRASFGLGAAAGVALMLGHLGVAALLAIAAALGDALDGMVARATRTVTKSGAVLDAAVDRYQEFFFLAGLALHYRADRIKLALTLLALVGSFMVSYGSAKADAMGVAAPRGAMRRAERAAYLCGGALLSPIAWAFADSVRVPPELASWVAEAPALLALALVGVVSNVSAVRRLEAVARAVSAPAAETAPRAAASTAPSTSSPSPALRDGGVVALAARQTPGRDGARAPKPAPGLAPR